MSAAPLFALEGVCVEFATPQGTRRAVHEVSLAIGGGECLAVVGESGSGKSQTFLACLGLLAANGRAFGSARFAGAELLGAEPSVLNGIRGTRMATVFQDPMNALTPHMTVGAQLAEVLTAHGLADERGAKRRAFEALRRVGLPDAERRFTRYPHELSGGQRQRVVIAMALMAEPALLIADEPTTALDIASQTQVLGLLGGLREQGLAIVLITHDLGLVAGLADRIAVMYAGRVVEEGPVDKLLAAPAHPYTAALERSVPRADAPFGRRLPAIEGQPPRLGEAYRGCAFEPRCPVRIARCALERPELVAAGSSSTAACHLVRPS
jgi:oligopeptide transport system ATP-binding protein